MASTYSPSLRAELIGSGDQSGTWGTTTNNNFQYIFEAAIAGYQTVAIAPTSNNQVLTYTNGPTATATADQSVYAILKLNASAVSANFNLFAPPASKTYVVWNNTSYTATFYNSSVIGNTTAAGSGITVPAGAKVFIWSDGTNFWGNDTIAGNLSIAGNLTVAGTSVHTGVASFGNQVTFSGGSQVASNGDLTVRRSSGTSGVLYFGNSTPYIYYDGSNFTFAGGAIYGAGTGLTGTASGLSIGGNAATATSATSATNATNATNATTAASCSGNAATASNPASGGSFITSSNIGSQSVNFATTSTTATNATNATNVAAGGTIASTVTGVTQALGTNNTTIATTAFALANGIPSGAIVMWSGSIASIPSGWLLCNGTSGTPDLRDRFVVGAGSTYAVAATGGTADAVVVSHTHTATVTDPGHTHTTSPATSYVGTAPGGHAGGGAANPDGYTVLSLASATTGISVANSTTGVSGTGQNLPPYYALAYIMKS